MDEIYDEDRRYQLANGMFIEDEELSARMRKIAQIRPLSPQKDSTGYQWNEIGLADLFMEIYQDAVRYCPERKSWYSFKDGKWQKDIGSLIVSDRIKEFCTLLDLYSMEIENDDLRQAFKKFLTKTGDRRFRDRIMKDAMDQKCISATMFDANPYLINCRNGTFDLENMVFRPAEWNDFLTMQTNFDYWYPYNVKKECKRWIQFIDEIMDGSQVKKDYIQKALGYSLLGSANEECMFIAYGKTTRNGKSTLLETIQHMLGDYSTVAPVGIICKSGGYKNIETASPTIAGLKGKRFVTMAESDEYGRFDEGVIKQLTGGEEITARNLYETAITYLPQFTLWLSCNDLPAVSDRSLFASERLRVIEFTRHFSAKERDKHLKEEFKDPENMKGIFMWLVQGYAKYKEEGLDMPSEIQDVVNQYERDNDKVLQFLEEKCEIDQEGKIKKKDLYDSYKMWCRSNGYMVSSARKFYADFLAHPEWYESEYKNHGIMTYIGLKFREGKI